MKKKLLAFLLAGMVTVPVLADKPDWAEKDSISQEQKETHRAAMKVKEDAEDVENGIDKAKAKVKKEKKKHEQYAQLHENANRDIINEQSKQLKDVEEQKNKKYDKVQKELDKGSEKGKESREQRKKWWKFWGE